MKTGKRKKTEWERQWLRRCEVIDGRVSGYPSDCCGLPELVIKMTTDEFFRRAAEDASGPFDYHVCPKCGTVRVR